MHRLHFDADNGTGALGWVLTLDTPNGPLVEPVGGLRKRIPRRLSWHPPRSVLGKARAVARAHGVQLPPLGAWFRMAGGWCYGAD